MDQEERYEWGELFAKGWDALVTGMCERASAMGLAQEERNGALIWRKGQREECRWLFVEDPSDIERVRAVYLNEENVRSPRCFVVVTQPDPSETRGDTIFDIFQLSPRSYLWHFNRVYTRPTRKSE